jgi:hypothetical protein
MRKIIILTFVCICAFACSTNQYSKLEFEQLTHQFDTIYPIEQSRHFFKYKNIGNNDLIIESIDVSCGCTIPYYNKSPLPTNKIDSILVEYNSTDNKGYFLKEIMVHSNAENSPIKLYIKGFAF